MKVYLSADIEGTCGICDWSETERSTRDDYIIYRVLRSVSLQSQMPQVPSMSALR